MRTVVLAAVLAVSGASFVSAEEREGASKPHVVVCDKDGMAERAIRREHGAVLWTTSAEVLAAVRSGDGWAAPRCMSNLEHWRMSDELRRAKRAEQARMKAQRLLASR